MRITKFISAALAAAMIITASGSAVPAAKVEAKSIIKDRIMVTSTKTYTKYDINGDGVNDTFYFYPSVSVTDKKNKIVKNQYEGWLFFVTIGGSGWRHEIQTISIDKKTTGKYYYNASAKKPKDTGTEIYMLRLKNGKSYLVINYYSKKGKYRDTQIYYHKNGQWLNKRAKNRKAFYNTALKTSTVFKNTGLKSLAFNTVSKNTIKYKGTFSNKQLGELTADVYFGYKSKTKLVLSNSKGKENKDKTFDVKSFRHYSVVTNDSGKQKVKTTMSSAEVTVRYKLGLYKDAKFTDVVTDAATGEAVVLLPGEKVKVKKIYINKKKYAIYVKSDKGSGYVNFVTEPSSDTDAIAEDGYFFDESVKPVINNDEPATGDEDPTTEVTDGTTGTQTEEQTEGTAV